MIRHVVVYRDGRALVDRQTLAQLASRSVHTVRARCAVIDRAEGKALYDMEDALIVLSELPKRHRGTATGQAA